MFGNHRTSFLSGVVNMAILFLDVDGTLINYKAQIPSSAKEAVIAARKNGHFVFLCTGCSKQEILERHFDFELDGFIGGNGNYIEVQIGVFQDLLPIDLSVTVAYISVMIIWKSQYRLV